MWFLLPHQEEGVELLRGQWKAWKGSFQRTFGGEQFSDTETVDHHQIRTGGDLSGLTMGPNEVQTLRLGEEGRDASIGPWSDRATPPYAPTDPALPTHPHEAA